MCDPTMMFAASMVTSALQVGTQYIGQQQAAEAQRDYQEKRYEATREAANEAYIREVEAENQRLVEEGEAVAAKQQEVQREKIEKQGTAIAASEGAGMSLDALLADFERQEARYRDSLMQTRENRERQSDRRKEGSRAKAINRTNQVMPQPVSSPSALGAGLKLAGAGLQAYDTYQPDFGFGGGTKDRK